MNSFRLVDGALHAEDVALTAIAARFGTPCYVYSRAALEARYRQYADAFAGTPHLVCYAMKANSNLAVLDVFARLGCGFDIVSGGELARVLAAGGDPAKVVFSGVGKTESEMEAALAARHPLLQRRVRGRARGAERGRRAAGHHRRRCRSASTRTSTRAPIRTSPPA